MSFRHRTCPHTKLKGVFDLRDKWVRELCDCHDIVVRKIASKYNIADLLTKCFKSWDFHRLVQLANEFNPKGIVFERHAKANICMPCSYTYNIDKFAPIIELTE